MPAPISIDCGSGSCARSSAAARSAPPRGACGQPCGRDQADPAGARDLQRRAGALRRAPAAHREPHETDLPAGRCDAGPHPRRAPDHSGRAAPTRRCRQTAGCGVSGSCSPTRGAVAQGRRTQQGRALVDRRSPARRLPRRGMRPPSPPLRLGVCKVKVLLGDRRTAFLERAHAIKRRPWQREQTALTVLEVLQGRPSGEPCAEHAISQAPHWPWRNRSSPTLGRAGSAPPDFRCYVLADRRVGATTSCGTVVQLAPGRTSFWPPLTLRFSWWSRAESNRRPLECHSSALPTELRPHAPAARWPGQPFHRSVSEWRIA
jgi:hypothetical protein